MHILFVTQYFAPEVGATQTRAHEFARACVAAGHRVTVLTEMPNHPHGEIFPEYRGRLLTRERLDGMTVLRVWVWTVPVKTLLTRLAFYGSFFALATVRGALVRPVDVVFATSPPLPVGLIGWILARVRGARFVLDIRDLWPAAARALGELEGRPALFRAATVLERFLYRHADRITAVTRGFVRHIASVLRDPGRVVWLPNGATAAVFRPDRVDPGLRARLGLDGQFVVTFAGNHGLAQGLDAVLEAANLLRRQDVTFCFVGHGTAKARLMARAEALELGNVRFLPEVPLEEVTPYLTMSDALLVPLARDPVFDTFIPSKLYDFLACARPVILMVNGEAREVLEASGGGISVAPEDAAGLAKAVLALMERSAEERQEMGERGRAFVLAHYTREAHAQRFLALLEALVRSR